MKIHTLIQHLHTIRPSNYFPHRSPAQKNLKDETVVVKFTNIARDPHVLPVHTITFQLLIRTKHPEAGEKVGFEYLNLLDEKEQFLIEGVEEKYHVFLSRANQPIPLFLEKEGNGLFLYSLNFTMYVKKL